MNAGQKILAAIGVLGLIFLSPVIFYTFGNTGPLETLQQNFGDFGDPSILTFVSFSMIGLAALMGGGKNLSATLVSFVIGCLLISTAVEISFLNWFKDLASNVDFLSNLKLNLLTGLFILLFGMFLSFAEKVSLGVEILALVVLPLGFLVGSNYAGILPNNTEFKISMNKGMESLRTMIDEKYMSQDNVKQYVEDIENDESLSEEEKVAKMEELQDKIKKLESDEEILAKLKAENEKYKQLIQSQEEKLKEYGWCAGSKDSSTQVLEFKDAVVPNQPCVRDFAVSLVKDQQGAYYDVVRALPGEQGLKQLCDLHSYLATNWKYISDPTMIRNDYYSPANRTIALGLAGDCDDFSILNASCVEAIGGVSRIMGGFCSGGGHAWAEVLIGSKSQWDRAVRVIRQHSGDQHKMLTPNIDENGAYWLPLDWRMGEFSCNNYPNKMMVLYIPKDRLQ